MSLSVCAAVAYIPLSPCLCLSSADTSPRSWPYFGFVIYCELATNHVWRASEQFNIRSGVNFFSTHNALWVLKKFTGVVAFCVRWMGLCVPLPVGTGFNDLRIYSGDSRMFLAASTPSVCVFGHCSNGGVGNDQHIYFLFRLATLRTQCFKKLSILWFTIRTNWIIIMFDYKKLAYYQLKLNGDTSWWKGKG